MNENDVYKVAYLRIKDALEEWGCNNGNEKDFINYASGVTEFCDDLLKSIEQKKL